MLYENEKFRLITDLFRYRIKRRQGEPKSSN